jgi:hypothetical protein
VFSGSEIQQASPDENTETSQDSNPINTNANNEENISSSEETADCDTIPAPMEAASTETEQDPLAPPSTNFLSSDSNFSELPSNIDEVSTRNNVYEELDLDAAENWFREQIEPTAGENAQTERR